MIKHILIALVIVAGVFYMATETNIFDPILNPIEDRTGIDLPFKKKAEIQSFEDCAKAGYPIMESYPEQCSDGENTFTRDISGDKSQCIITGCSAHICADEEVATTCEWLPEYACYRTAVCERQVDGECRWTLTPELTECLGSVN